MVKMILQDNVVMGTFTHRTKYLNNLLESVKKYYPDVLFIIQIADLPINQNFNALRQKFAMSGKKYWLFLDDDIEFIDSEVISKALETLIRNKYAMVGCYSTFDPNYEKNQDLIEKEVTWIPGYFQLVDSSKINNITSDLNLPDPNTSIDTCFSIDVNLAGNKLGVCPGLVYHNYKIMPVNTNVISITNRYLFNKYGNYYFDRLSNPINIIVGGLPKNELELNKLKLIEWQNNHYYLNEKDKIKLNVGSGDLKYPGYINLDKFNNPDCYIDLNDFLPFKNNSVDEITCHHVLEHISHLNIKKVLQEFYRILNKDNKDNILDIGIPDLKLCCEYYINNPNNYYNLYNIYGSQVDKGQFHNSGLSKDNLLVLLKEIGFNIIDSYNYDGNGTPSVYCLCSK